MSEKQNESNDSRKDMFRGEYTGNDRKRDFKYKEMDYELRNEPKESPRKRFSSASTTKTYHKVPFTKKDDAKKEGMRWDSDKKKWYHTDPHKSKSSQFPLHEEFEELDEASIDSIDKKIAALKDKIAMANEKAKMKAGFKRSPGAGHTAATEARVNAWRKQIDDLLNKKASMNESDESLVECVVDLNENMTLHGKYKIQVGAPISGAPEHHKVDHVVSHKSKLSKINVKADSSDPDEHGHSDRYGTTHRVAVTNTDTGETSHHHIYQSGTKGTKPLMSVRSIGSKHNEEHHKVLSDYLSGKKPTTKYVKEETMNPMQLYMSAIEGNADFRSGLTEKTLTSAELKKREEVAKAIERENPDMPMGKKMAIATATAKKVAEATDKEEERFHKKLDTLVHKTFGKGKHELKKEETDLIESHFKVGDEVKCKASGMEGKVVKLDTPEQGKYYTVELENGKTAKYAPEELVKESLQEATFASTMKKAIAAHERGDHKRAKYHLDNAKTARYAMKSTEISKHKDLLDKYKEMRDMHEDVELDEAISDHDKQMMKYHAAKARPEVERTKKVSRAYGGEKAARNVEQGFRSTIKRDYKKRDAANEEVELDEISQKTVGKYLDKAQGDFTHQHMASRYGVTQDERDEAARKKKLRQQGITRAVNKMTKEEYTEENNLEEGMISYSQFMDKIAMHRKMGNKVIDHKYSDKQAHYTTVDSEGIARKVTHTDRGSKVENLGQHSGDDDKAAPTQTAKRGRGRPAGSKSGVTKYN